MPKALGGGDELENMQIAHLYCQKVQGGMLGRGKSKQRSYETCSRAGRISGRMSVETGRLSRVQKLGSAVGNHIRWHVARGIVSKECQLCP
jgi:hypothetical protein